MNIKNKLFSQIASLLFLAMIPISASAQQKSFTQEDLNYGGTNYRNMVAQNRWCTWWGDELVRQDVDACYLVNKKNGKETKLFGIDDINKWIAPTRDRKVRALYNAVFRCNRQRHDKREEISRFPAFK